MNGIGNSPWPDSLAMGNEFLVRLLAIPLGHIKQSFSFKNINNFYEHSPGCCSAILSATFLDSGFVPSQFSSQKKCEQIYFKKDQNFMALFYFLFHWTSSALLDTQNWGGFLWGLDRWLISLLFSLISFSSRIRWMARKLMKEFGWWPKPFWPIPAHFGILWAQSGGHQMSPNPQ
jgi:hypothetical protein